VNVRTVRRVPPSIPVAARAIIPTMRRTITHPSGAEYIEIEVDPPGGATTLVLRLGDWTGRVDVAVGAAQDDAGEQHLVEVSAFEVPSGEGG